MIEETAHKNWFGKASLRISQAVTAALLIELVHRGARAFDLLLLAGALLGILLGLLSALWGVLRGNPVGAATAGTVLGAIDALVILWLLASVD